MCSPNLIQKKSNNFKETTSITISLVARPLKPHDPSGPNFKNTISAKDQMPFRISGFSCINIRSFFGLKTRVRRPIVSCVLHLSSEFEVSTFTRFKIMPISPPSRKNNKKTLILPRKIEGIFGKSQNKVRKLG